jgi:hypothetical protein
VTVNNLFCWSPSVARSQLLGYDRLEGIHAEFQKGKCRNTHLKHWEGDKRIILKWILRDIDCEDR